MLPRARSWALLAVVLVALCPAVAGAARKKVATKVLSDAGQVAAGKDDGFSQRCPKAFPHPVGTEFGGANENLALDESFALGHRRWNLGLRNFGGASETFFGGPVCLRAPGRFAYPQKSGVVPAGGNATVTVTCPRRTPRVLNGMLAPRGGADVGQLVMSRSVPSGRRRWVVGVRNVGPDAHAFLAGAVCATAKLRVVYRLTDPISVAAGQGDGGRGDCPKRARHPIAATFAPADATGEGQFTLAAAAEDDPGSLSVIVTNRGPATERVMVGEICVG